MTLVKYIKKRCDGLVFTFLSISNNICVSDEPRSVGSRSALEDDACVDAMGNCNRKLEMPSCEKT